MDERTKLIAELATRFMIHGYQRHNGMQVITETCTSDEAVFLARKVINRAEKTAADRID